MTNKRVRQTRTATFPDASHDDERIAAVLIAKDSDTGELKAHVTHPPHRNPPHADAVAMLVQSAEIENL